MVGIDEERRIAELKHAAGGRLPKFSNGGPLIHDRVRQEMRQVYLDSDLPPFLDAKGRELLDEARATFHRLELANNSALPKGRDTWLFPWVGDRVLHTLGLLFLTRDATAVTYGPALQLTNTPIDLVMQHIEELTSLGLQEGSVLATSVQNKRTEKHHRYLSEGLLNVDYASSQMDVAGALEAMGRLT